MRALRTVHSIKSGKHINEVLENNPYSKGKTMLMKNIQKINVHFISGAIRGAIVGAFIGIAPGILLVMVLSGGLGSYYVGSFEVLSFTAISITIGGLIGSIIGGMLNIIALLLKTTFVKIQGIS